MTSDMGALIRADLGSIKNATQDLLGTASIAPAMGGAVDGEAHGATAQSFLASMGNAVRGVDAKERDATDQMAAVDSGRSDDLVGAMLSSQQASLSFSMLMQVRNKVMGAVDDLIKLPI